MPVFPDRPPPARWRRFAVRRPDRPAVIAGGGTLLPVEDETAALVRELAEAMDRPEHEVAAAAVRLLGITYALQQGASAGRSAVGWTLAGGETRLVA